MRHRKRTHQETGFEFRIKVRDLFQKHPYRLVAGFFLTFVFEDPQFSPVGTVTAAAAGQVGGKAGKDHFAGQIHIFPVKIAELLNLIVAELSVEVAER